MRTTNKTFLYFFILVSSVLLVYWQAFDNPLIFDSLALRLPPKEDPWGLFESLKWWWDYVLTKPTAEFSLNRKFFKDTFEFTSRQFGIGMYGQNVINVCIHTANAALLYVFLKLLYSRKAAALTSLFFALNPAAIYAVAYLIQRSQLLMLFFALLQAIFYVYALRPKWYALGFFALSLFCFKFACMSKESAAVLLMMYPILSIAFREWNMSMLYLSVTMFLVALEHHKILSHIKLMDDTEYYRAIVENSCASFVDQSSLYLRSILTQCGLFFKYFIHWLLPLPASIDMKVKFAGDNDIHRALFFASYILGALSLLFRRSTRFLGAGLIMAAAFFAPELSRVRVGESFVLYRSYIWSLGYMIVVGWVVNRFRTKVALAVYIVLLGAITYGQLRHFNSDVEVWTHAAAKIDLETPEIACQGARSFNNAGSALLQEGQFHKATKYFQQACDLNQTWMMPFSNLGSTYYLLGDFDRARPVLEKVVTATEEGMAENAKSILERIDARTR